MERYAIEFGNYKGKFKLYANYSKRQVSQILNVDYNMSFKQRGIIYPDSAGISYFFVSIEKDKLKEEKNNYKNKFISPNILQWESENRTQIDNKNGIKLLKTKKTHIFIRKTEEEAFSNEREVIDIEVLKDGAWIEIAGSHLHGKIFIDALDINYTQEYCTGCCGIGLSRIANLLFAIE